MQTRPATWRDAVSVCRLLEEHGVPTLPFDGPVAQFIIGFVAGIIGGRLGPRVAARLSGSNS